MCGSTFNEGRTRVRTPHQNQSICSRLGLESSHPRARELMPRARCLPDHKHHTEHATYTHARHTYHIVLCCTAQSATASNDRVGEPSSSSSSYRRRRSTVRWCTFCGVRMLLGCCCCSAVRLCVHVHVSWRARVAMVCRSVFAWCGAINICDAPFCLLVRVSVCRWIVAQTRESSEQHTLQSRPRARVNGRA